MSEDLQHIIIWLLKIIINRLGLFSKYVILIILDEKSYKQEKCSQAFQTQLNSRLNVLKVVLKYILLANEVLNEDAKFPRHAESLYTRRLFSPPIVILQ